MNNFEQYLVELLQRQITLNDEPVEVVKQFSRDPHLPVITLDMSRGVNTEYSYRKYEEKEVLCFYRNTTININVWCNTEEERESLNNQVLQCFYDEKNNHYRYCTRYNDGICNTSGTACAAINDNGIRGCKDRCPTPDTLHYESLQRKYGIVNGTLDIEPPFDLDEEGEHPSLLRSVLEASADYVEEVSNKGQKGLEYTNGVEII